MNRIDYEGRELFLDLEDMDTEHARVMERHGIPNLKALDDGVKAADVKCLTFLYWLCLVQNGEPGTRIERVSMKPIKFLKALAASESMTPVDEPGKEPAE